MSTQVIDKKTKDQIILENLPLVKKVASKIYYRLPKGEIDFDELVNTGIIGLMKAIDRYDKDKAKFSTYAYIKIRGEILDYLRSLDVMPRSMREKIKEENLEEGKNLPLSKTAIMVSIEKAIVNGDEEFRIVDTLVSNRISPEEEVIKEDIRDKLLQAIEMLNEKEQIALQMLYFEEKSLQEVANVLNVSVSRVSQIKSEAVKKLKKIFKI
ncbi:MAG: sigma-70 family RNA polymerase sigma factor [Aquificae bacterium]|nr:sigma-70 family RNA polymerase sigma factor [Aquificota bacterium]